MTPRRDRRPDALVVVGTRPEAVKLAPVVLALRRRGARVVLLSTGQHRELLRDGLAPFGLAPDEDLRLMRPRQTPRGVLAAALPALDAALARLRPARVVVQGDTTSALAGALAAFRREIPVAHVEAGLRSGDLAAPYPEEFNRVAIDAVSSLRFAPTARARKALLAEGAPPASVRVTGNTVVDAVRAIAARRRGFRTPALRRLPRDRDWALLTLHRRESHGAPLRAMLAALARAAERHPRLLWACPVHPNPEVRAAFAPLAGRRGFALLPPLPYADFIALLARCRFAVTDSGGVQEEAPSLGVPYLVARRVTERPEGLGRWGRLVGVSPAALERAASAWAARPPRPGKGSPFGDGRAGERIAAALLALE